jgi:uncharacterized protein HemY
MGSIAVRIGLFLVRTAVSIALDRRVRELATQAVQEADVMQIDDSEKLRHAARAVHQSHAAKQLPGILKTLAVERAVEEIHKRL